MKAAEAMARTQHGKINKNSLFDGNGIESHGDGSVYNGQFKSGNIFYYYTLQVKEMGKGN